MHALALERAAQLLAALVEGRAHEPAQHARRRRTRQAPVAAMSARNVERTFGRGANSSRDSSSTRSRENQSRA